MATSLGITAVKMDYEEALSQGDENNLGFKELEKVPEEVVKQNETALWPQVLSLGPLHHLRLLGKSRIRLYNIICAAELAKPTLLRIQSAIEALPVTHQLHQSYLRGAGAGACAGNPGHLEMEQFVMMMVLDSIFLLYFLCEHAKEKEEEDEEVQIKCDVVMLDNQLPLQVLYTVMDVLRTTAPPQTTLLKWLLQPLQLLLQQAVQKMSPFTHQSDRDNMTIFIQEQERNLGLDNKDLLHMLHAAVAKLVVPNDFSRSNQDPSRRTKSIAPCKWIRDTLATVLNQCSPCIDHAKTPLHLSMYRAEALKKAGVKFRQGTPHCFDRHSDMLWLPCINICHLYTETVLCNLMALELNQYYHINGSNGNGSGSGSHVCNKAVTQYVALMDCLITTADDVHLLRKAGVIVSRPELNDKEVVHMWSTIARPFIPRRQKPMLKDIRSELDQVLRRNYYRNFVRTQRGRVADRIVEFAHTYMSTCKAWAVILTVLLGAIVFANELIQAYCTFTKCNPS